MRKKITVALSGIVAIATIIIAIDKYFDYKEIQNKHAEYAKLLPLIKISTKDSFEAQADKIRRFIFQNTQFGEGDDFRKIWGNHPIIVKRISNYANKSSETPPPLECSSRSGVMESLLTTLGYDIRSIVVHDYGPDYDSHTFLEVRHPQTQKWHVQDPQFNLFWRHTQTQERLGIHDLVALPYTSYEPCINDTQCGWDLPNKEGHDPKELKQRFGLAVAIDRKRGERPLFVNESRFQLNKAQSVNGKNQTYCEYRKKNCRGTIHRF